MGEDAEPVGAAGQRIERAAELIWSAWSAGRVLDELPRRWRPGDATAGWAVARAVAGLAGPSYGYKIAATSRAGQAHIGVGAPLPGPLFDRFRREPGDRLTGLGHMRVVEAEFAFRMGRDVPPGADPEQVLAAVEAMHLAIEVPNSRFEHFDRVGAPSLLADAACAGWFVLGPAVPGWRSLDLAAWSTAVTINGADPVRGSGGNVLGDPRTALTWLAGALDGFGTGLRSGEVVTTGTTTVPPTVGPGDRVRADFGELGTVSLSFAD